VICINGNGPLPLMQITLTIMEMAINGNKPSSLTVMAKNTITVIMWPGGDLA